MAPQARFCSNACRVRDKRAQESRERLATEALAEYAGDSNDVFRDLTEVFHEESFGRGIGSYKRRHVPFQASVAA
jgi:hypothetical protein